jgi:hypothetical protein
VGDDANALCRFDTLKVFSRGHFASSASGRHFSEQRGGSPHQSGLRSRSPIAQLNVSKLVGPPSKRPSAAMASSPNVPSLGAIYEPQKRHRVHSPGSSSVGLANSATASPIAHPHTRLTKTVHEDSRVPPARGSVARWPPLGVSIRSPNLCRVASSAAALPELQPGRPDIRSAPGLLEHGQEVSAVVSPSSARARAASTPVHQLRHDSGGQGRRKIELSRILYASAPPLHKLALHSCHLPCFSQEYTKGS